eukprot:483475-Rhodomonas_salina.2
MPGTDIADRALAAFTMPGTIRADRAMAVVCAMHGSLRAEQPESEEAEGYAAEHGGDEQLRQQRE